MTAGRTWLLHGLMEISPLTTPRGSFVLMLHTHLPFYRQAGRWPFGEENLYECWAEVYVPLVCLLKRLHGQGKAIRINLGITPVLLEQLNDPYLKQGFAGYLDDQIHRAKADIERFTQSGQTDLAALARYHQATYEKVWTSYQQELQSDWIAAVRQLSDAGVVELVASAATHALLPLIRSEASLKAQVDLGVSTCERYFGKKPRGFWLPECGYRPAQHRFGQYWPGMEHYLEAAGIEYFFTEYHAIEGASSSYNIFQSGSGSPQQPEVASPSVLFEVGTQEAYQLSGTSLAVLARNNEASFQVWSSSYGYPGDGAYREFHKADDVSGLRYWRLTSKACDLGQKSLYDPAIAQAKALEHAAHFVAMVQGQVAQSSSDRPVLIHTAFDTELFGHWWHEGLVWLEAVLDGLSMPDSSVALQSASEYLAQCPARHGINLPELTWGQGGHFWVWQNQQTDWIWQSLEAADRRLSQWLNQNQGKVGTSLAQRVLAQAQRELMLMQASDWPFLITTHQAKEYAINRFNGHQERFAQLMTMLENDNIDQTELTVLEGQDNLFATLNPARYWQPDAVTQSTTPV